MNISIATFHWSQNYGALLQTYALKKHLEDLGHSVSIIDCKPDSKHKKESISSRIKDLILLSSHPLDHFRIKKQCACLQQFRLEHFSLIDEKEIRDIDAIVCGSDQIWNSKLTGGALFPLYFGLSQYYSFPKRIAYAASLGEKEIPEKDKTRFQEYLKGMDYVSVREESLVNLVENYTDKKIANVIDPTLLLDTSDYIRLIDGGCIKTNQKYVLIYQNTYDARLSRIADAIAQSIGGIVVEIARKRYRPFSNHRIILNGGVETFLSMYQNASYVITNTFHGTVFALQFKKQFFSIPLKGRESRVLNLLHQLGLENRIISIERPDCLNEPDIDYSIVESSLSKMRKQSDEFLSIALGGD